MHQVAFAVLKKIAGGYWHFIVIFALLAFILVIKFQNSKIQAELKAAQKELQIKTYEAESAQKSLNDIILRREFENKVLSDLSKESYDLQKEIQHTKDSYDEKNDIVSNFRAVSDRLFREADDINTRD